MLNKNQSSSTSSRVTCEEDKYSKNNISKNDESNKTMTAEEMGRKGGEATAATHGREFYQEIGHKGGEARAEQMREAKADKDDERTSTNNTNRNDRKDQDDRNDRKDQDDRSNRKDQDDQSNRKDRGK